MPKQHSLVPILAALALVVPFSAPAQVPHMIHTQAKAPASSVAWSDGVVKTIHKQEGQMTLAHGPLVNLGMGKMTMTFRVKAPALIEGI